MARPSHDCNPENRELQNPTNPGRSAAITPASGHQKPLQYSSRAKSLRHTVIRGATPLGRQPVGEPARPWPDGTTTVVASSELLNSLTYLAFQVEPYFSEPEELEAKAEPLLPKLLPTINPITAEDFPED